MEDKAAKKAAYLKAYYAKNREKLLEKQRERGKRNYQAKPEQYAKRSKEWREANPERCKELVKNHANQNKDKMIERSREWYKSNKKRASAKARVAKLKRYGLTPELFQKMIESQGSKCLICMKQFNALCVDHCHSTGIVRGLLCRLCNAGLGAFRDNPEALQNAILYLSRSSSGATSTTSSSKSSECSNH